MDHVGNGQLIQQLLPACVIVIGTTQLGQGQAVACAGDGHLGAGIDVHLKVEIGVELIDLHILCAHIQRSGGSGGLGVVCKAVCTGQVGYIAVDIVK